MDLQITAVNDVLEELLPGYNCGKCGFKTCSDFADYLKLNHDFEKCPFLLQDRFKENRENIISLLENPDAEEEIRGVVDGVRASFTILPLPGEPSCREDLFPMDRDIEISENDVIKYRPLGCPITHFAKVLNVSHGILTVHMIGPRNLIGDDGFEPLDIGICMVAAFEGIVGKGTVPKVCETVRFLPDHCMMGKVHSGIVVSIEGRKIRIEGIDLKVW